MKDWNEAQRAGQSPRLAADAAVAAQAREGAELLDDVRAYLRKFVVYPSPHASVAHALWVAHAHAMDAWNSTPRIAFLSPEPASGKSRALEVTEPLVPRPILAINVTPAFLFRRVDAPEGRPTVLHDEVDSLWGPKAKKDYEEIRALYNAGHRRGAVAGRCVLKGKTVTTEELAAYAAVALAGLGDLPDTIMSRSVVIRMRRRALHEYVDPFRRSVHEPEGHALRDRLAAWLVGLIPTLSASRPAMPPGVDDRDADCWEALLAVADAAGGQWPVQARAAAVALVASSKATTASLGVRLLADIRAVFGDRDVIATKTLLADLHALEEAPWANLRGAPLDARGLASRVNKYGITSKTVRVGLETPKGYTRADFADAWTRYLPEPTVSPNDVADVADVAELWGDRQRGRHP